MDIDQRRPARPVTQDRPDHYPFREIETKWQRVWEETGLFRVREEPGRPKFY